MKKEEIINIGKELIVLAGTYNQTKEKKAKDKIIGSLEKYEKDLSKNKTKYSNIVLGFVKDLKSDLELGKKLDIDTIKNDDYIENYFITKNELEIYNSLILIDEYKEIIGDLKEIKIKHENISKNIKK